MRLDIAGVAVEIDDTAIVHQADLAVGPGEVVALVGPNGSGKSTLLRTVYRALRPHTGAVLIDGADVWRLSARESAQRTAVVAQETPADFDFTAYEVVAMGRTPHKRAFERDSAADRELCHQALARVGMDGFARRIYSTLSGGEKQCVLIARAIAQQTQLLILDEPTNHLDVCYQHEILTLVRSLGVTTVAALHDLNLASTYCDRLFVMRDGHIVASGSPDEVLTPAPPPRCSPSGSGAGPTPAGAAPTSPSNLWSGTSNRRRTASASTREGEPPRVDPAQLALVVARRMGMGVRVGMTLVLGVVGVAVLMLVVFEGALCAAFAVVVLTGVQMTVRVLMLSVVLIFGMAVLVLVMFLMSTHRKALHGFTAGVNSCAKAIYCSSLQ